MSRAKLHPILATVYALALGACAGTAAPPVAANGLYADPIGTAPVTANDTPYSEALICLSQYARSYGRPSPRIAVGRISDYTGKQDDFQGGPKLTQGASLMAITALAKSGARLVERYDNSVSELELKYANGKLISDSGQGAGEYRQIPVGMMSGSDYVLIGGITELNYNIRSSGADAAVGGQAARDLKGQFRSRSYIMNVGIDLRLVDTKTSDIVDVVSYQKQIVGREVSAGVFSFFGDTVVDLSGGKGGLEPMQLAVRSEIERAVLEMMSGLYRLPGPEACLSRSPDPLAPERTRSAYSPIGGGMSWAGRRN
ncbi:holdfast anchoring protein HfaB [Phenylobacterium conjunctum]|uniref:Holdfast anchoring protein HfaB n=1 Tax=Phenylobacterium conjunctum TaxID=1298959 RepID=A0ABW3SWZ9_9CAUL